jgi:energy-converting hydrogenase Eha subunit A
LTFGIASINSSKRWFAIAGIVLCIVGLMAGLMNAIYGAYLGYTGQHPLFQ